MSGYQFACSFRAVPSFFSHGLDRDFLNILQSQGFEPNDTGRRIIQQYPADGFTGETELEGRWRGRFMSLYLGRGRYNQIGFTWPARGYFRDPTREAVPFLRKRQIAPTLRWRL